MIPRRILRLALSVAVISCAWAAPSHAATIWTDWSGTGLVFDSGSGGAANGTLGSVDVSYTGQLIGAIVDGSSGLWAPDTTFSDGTIVTTSPSSVGDNLDIDGATPGGTITFSSPVVDPVFAIMSLGNSTTLASFTFTQTPTFVVGGPSSFFGGGAISVVGNTVSGQEGNGVIQFIGTYSSISWTNTLEPDSGRYSFTVGVADDSAAVPEPSSVALLGFGLVGLVGFLKRKRS